MIDLGATLFYEDISLYGILEIDFSLCTTKYKMSRIFCYLKNLKVILCSRDNYFLIVPPINE